VKHLCFISNHAAALWWRWTRLVFYCMTIILLCLVRRGWLKRSVTSVKSSTETWAYSRVSVNHYLWPLRQWHPDRIPGQEWSCSSPSQKLPPRKSNSRNRCAWLRYTDSSIRPHTATKHDNITCLTDAMTICTLFRFILFILGGYKRSSRALFVLSMYLPLLYIYCYLEMFYKRINWLIDWLIDCSLPENACCW